MFFICLKAENRALIMLKGTGISKSYSDRSSGKRISVLSSADITIAPGEAIAVMGRSGEGKSTLARILLKLERPDSGKILLNGQDITDCAEKELRDFRRQVQFISQRPESFLDPIMTLGQSMREPLKVFDLPEDTEEINRLLEAVQLNETILDRYPHQVSGGEIQRICLARALLLSPRLLVLDEPTSMLDISVQAQILQLLKDIQSKRDIAYFFITHDIRLADFLCSRVLRLQDGNLKA